MENSLEIMRHSAAHVLAAAVMELWPEAKLGVGPVVENGFYYDIDPGVTLTPNDLARLEKRMNMIVSRKEPFRREEMPIADAITFFRERKQDFKVDLLVDLLRGDGDVPQTACGGAEAWISQFILPARRQVRVPFDQS